MNLRNVTIWTTGVMMVAIFVAPFVILPNTEGLVGMILTMILALQCWLCFAGSPLLVSFVLARTYEPRTSCIILILSTIAYGVWYFYMVYSQSASGWTLLPHRELQAISVLIGILSLPMMIPAWITVLLLDAEYANKLLDAEYANKTPNPGTTAAPSSPPLRKTKMW